METKMWWQSKTVWLQLLGLVAVVVPASSEFLKEYFSEAGSAWVALNLILRWVTKDKVQIS